MMMSMQIKTIRINTNEDVKNDDEEVEEGSLRSFIKYPPIR
jgi:hypothetical protein